MQQTEEINKRFEGCFYLANSRQMQQFLDYADGKVVVFTLQTAGRCNIKLFSYKLIIVVFTLQTAGRCNMLDDTHLTAKLFLPCKQQADATAKDFVTKYKALFLPCKQQADATYLT